MSLIQIGIVGGLLVIGAKHAGSIVTEARRLVKEAVGRGSEQPDQTVSATDRAAAERAEAIEAARRITVDHFKSLMEQSDVTLDRAILDFEKATHTSLEEFARSKGRTADNYRDAYIGFYREALESVRI